MKDIKKVVSLFIIDKFTIKLIFSNGEKRILDVSQYQEGKIFKPIFENEELYNSVKIDKLGGIEWNNGACLSPETIYLRSNPIL